MRRRRVCVFAPSVVVTVAALGCSNSTKAPHGEDASLRGGTADARIAKNPPPVDDPPPPPPRDPLAGMVFDRGQCHIDPDCRPTAEGLNPCNPPPPRQIVDCPPELLPTRPPGLAVERNADGTCWVRCPDGQCGTPGPLRVRCPADGEPEPTYETALVIPTKTETPVATGTFRREKDLTCTLTEKSGKVYDKMPCGPELGARTAPGVVPVSTVAGCFYGKAPVVCPDPVRTRR